MTDITDQDRRLAREWAASVDPEMDRLSDSTRAVARVILATVDAPPRTLAEELQYRADLLDNGDPDGDTPQALRDLADHAAQMEHDLAEARAEVERRTTVQKGAESNTETPDPADVPPGKAWLVECRGERRNAVKDNDYSVQWCTVNADDWFNAEKNEDVTLVTRLVPAPRVITNPDELDALAEGAIVRDFADGEALQKIDGMWIAARRVRSAGYHSGRITPVTVLWEPEA